MLLEKAYAKLHGSYESIKYGFIEKIFYDFLDCGNVKVIRMEELNKNTACDYVWDELEKGVQEKRLSILFVFIF